MVQVRTMRGRTSSLSILTVACQAEMVRIDAHACYFYLPKI